MKMVLLFKSGSQIKFEVEQFSVSTHPTTGVITSMSWTTPDNAKTKLVDVTLMELACVWREN